MTSVLQPWVAELGLRHQGALMSCVRGCDGLPKNDPTKALTRCLRAVLLVSCDPKPTSFIETVAASELEVRMVAVLKDFDHLPAHYLLHLAQGSEIVGYCHPDPYTRECWCWFCTKLCRCFHLNPETQEQMEGRLNAREDKFAKSQEVTWTNQ
jgi:hypothetical protein